MPSTITLVEIHSLVSKSKIFILKDKYENR